MGLEHIALVLAAEEEFNIVVPDEVYQRMVTVGDFFDVILALVRESGTSDLRGRVDLEGYLWSRAKALAAEYGNGIEPEDITRTTPFIEDLGYG